MMTRLLIVDDEPSIRKVLSAYLKQAGYSVTAVASAEEGLESFTKEDIDLVIVDLRLEQGMDGLEFIRECKARRSRVPLIMITAYGTTDIAVQAMKEGAYDFVSKPFDFAGLLDTVKKALADTVPVQNEKSDSSEEPVLHFGTLVGESPEMQRIYEVIEKVAPTDASTLIEGESGTGKELVAQAMHERSKRKEGPLVPINCGAIPPALLESELFGYKAGAFTGADSDRKGLIQEAHTGTLFLDEIGVMDFALQRKLLRTLQEGNIRPLGQNKDIEVDVRIIAATNEDIEAKKSAGEFREDLYYRLSVIPLKLPPLRRRRQDIPLLARHFCAEQSRKMNREIHLTDRALEAMYNYAWPGNIRELENAIACAATMCNDNLIRVSDLPPNIAFAENGKMSEGDDSSVSYNDIEEGKTLRDFLREKERDYMEAVLRHTGGNRAKAADLLGISRTTFYRKFPEPQQEKQTEDKH